MVLACTELDLATPEPCILTAKNAVKSARKAAGQRAALHASISSRNVAKRDDLVIHSAAIVEGRPRFMQSVAPSGGALPQ